MFAVFAAFDRPNVVVVEVDGNPHEMDADAADDLAAKLTAAATLARSNTEGGK